MVTVRHPIRIQIDKYDFLNSLIENYPNYVKAWMDSRSEEIEQYNEEVEAEDGTQVTINRLQDYIDNHLDFEETLFYQAMLVMVYSYYESILEKFAEVLKCKRCPSDICNTVGETLSAEAFEKASFIFDNVKELRDLICHNNAGSKGRNPVMTMNALKTVQGKGVYSYHHESANGWNGSEILSINKEFLCNALSMEHDILVELAEKTGCNYKRLDSSKSDVVK